jgi:hypothetical protein
MIVMEGSTGRQLKSGFSRQLSGTAQIKHRCPAIEDAFCDFKAKGARKWIMRPESRSAQP